MTGLRLGALADGADLASFLGRAVALDPAALTRLRAGGERVTAYVRLPFGVLVSRTVTGAADPADVTVSAADMVAALDAPLEPDLTAGGVGPAGEVGPLSLARRAGATGPTGAAGSTGADGSTVAGRPVSGMGATGPAGAAGPADAAGRMGAAGPVGAGPVSGAGAGGTGRSVAWPALQDVRWRAALPPGGGWRLLDQVPGDVIRALVRAGREALRAVPAGAAASAGETLLDHESLTVTGAGRTVALPLRVLSALTRMGFLGDGGRDAVMVSAAGGWVRLAGPYGSAYHHGISGLGLSPR